MTREGDEKVWLFSSPYERVCAIAGGSVLVLVGGVGKASERANLQTRLPNPRARVGKCKIEKPKSRDDWVAADRRVRTRDISNITTGQAHGSGILSSIKPGHSAPQGPVRRSGMISLLISPSHKSNDSVIPSRQIG